MAHCKEIESPESFWATLAVFIWLLYRIAMSSKTANVAQKIFWASIFFTLNPFLHSTIELHKLKSNATFHLGNIPCTVKHFSNLEGKGFRWTALWQHWKKIFLNMTRTICTRRFDRSYSLVKLHDTIITVWPISVKPIVCWLQFYRFGK